MRKLILAVVTAMLLLPFVGGGAEAKGQTYIDSMVLDNINLRRRAEIYKSRRGAGATNKNRRGPSAAAKNARARKSPGTAAAPNAAGASVNFGMDLYNYFAEDDPNGFTIQFSFSPSHGSGTSFHRTHKFNTSRNLTSAELQRIPAGHYTVTAEATYRGRSHRVLLATAIGEPTNAKGGNFAPSLNIQVRGGESSPRLIWIRVVN